jgi:hypothetical protein
MCLADFQQQPSRLWMFDQRLHNPVFLDSMLQCGQFRKTLMGYVVVCLHESRRKHMVNRIVANSKGGI